MHAHPDFIARFGSALRGGPVPEGMIAPDPAEVARRFAIYRNNVAVSLTEALAKRFPAIRRLVGDALFAAMARLYAETDPPASPVLTEWGSGFAVFLEGFPPLAAYPYLGDVARLEFARGTAFHAPDAAPVDPARLIAADPDRVRLVLHPSVTLLWLDHPAVSIWALNQPGAKAAPLPAGPETALILRDAGFQVPVRALGAGDAAMVEAIQSGACLFAAAAKGQAVEAGHDPQPLLLHLMQAGAIVDARE